MLWCWWDHPGDAHLQQEAALAWCAQWAAARDAPLPPSSWSPSRGDRVGRDISSVLSSVL